MSLRILIADDNADTLLTLRMLLEEDGHHVRTLDNGGAVVPAVEEFAPNVCILDIEMPGKSGFAIAQELRHAYGDHTPMLIAISGKWTGQTDELLGRIVGFKHYCIKPCEPQKLLELLEPLTGV